MDQHRSTSFPDAGRFLGLAQEGDIDDELDLGQFDLNLLLVLGSLFHHRNITHAGSALQLSQPATSRALTRLREVFSDELLTRENRSFELTPLSRVLMPKLETALDSIEQVFNNRMRMPERFSVAMPDHIAFFLAPRLTAYIRQISAATVFLPSVRLANSLNEMSEGGIDLALGVAEDAPTGFFCRALPPIPTIGLARKGHAALQGNITYPELGQFLSIRIGAAYNAGFGELSDGLEAIRPRGRETVTVPDIHTAARLVHDTDAILVLPSPSAYFLGERFGLQSFVPRKGPSLPPYQISLIWHERWHRSSLHSGVRSMVASQVLDNRGEDVVTSA
jgi:DNA-binding transcriptional LysR family regulator